MLVGGHNTGKTTTCRLVKKELEQSGAKKISIKGISQRNVHKDSKGDFTFVCVLRNKKILISSQGDIPSRVKDKIKKYTAITDIDIFVFVCRDSFKDVIEYAKSKSGGNNILLITKKEPTDEDNNKALKEILKEIE
jgi:hypothetical protein